MNDTIKTIHHLRTIHGDFSDKKIDDKYLDIILQAAIRAATASARQSYSIIVIKDKEKIRQLSEYVGDTLLVFCVDFTRLIELAKHLNHTFEISDAIGFVTGSADTMMAAQTACIAAKSLGIDSLFTQRGLHRRDIKKVFEMLNLPEQYCFPLIALVLGYPRVEPSFQKGRLSEKSVIHWDTYHPLSPEEKASLITQYDDKNQHLGLIENWEQFGLAHYLDWFYTKWAQRPDTKNFVLALKRAGFLPSEK